ncbi:MULTISPECIES: VWA domain-containing protein [Gilliamella]|uniref:vWA domain-containing protein n=1 Tax=Gilliamella TaxID=1193503 RepID=UPI000A33A6BD|nr:MULTISPECIES: VWA domain-containing protein [Gilliamella]MBI0153912.1 VWA domain-containing protein [Gilliamella sp. W8128]MBI0155764.1 VWA domain-containing protein [Gilliamella sp. M0364]MCT6885718.1 VWA domain-containing protein [Gilliamella apis]
MKFIKIFAMLSFSVCSLFSHAQPIKQIQVRSELSSPIIMEGNPETNYLKVSLSGQKIDNSKRVPINLAIVIDKSSSMGGDRIEKAREAAIFAVNLLNENDTLSIVAYDSEAKVIVPASKVKNKQKLIQVINENVVANGGTALFAGLSKGIKQVETQLTKDKVNRIILLSDGQANVGPSSVNELSELAIIAAKKNISITTIGIGSDYNELLMSSIASYSDGNHVFVNKSTELENVFVHEFSDVMSTIAQDVVITIQLKDGVKPVRLLGRDGVIKGNKVTVKMNQLFSNQEKYVLLEVIPDEGKVGQSKTLAEIDLKYDNLLVNKAEHETQLVSVAYTDNQKLVQNSIIQDVLAESEIQKVTIANEKALELYNRGMQAEAEKILMENSNRLASFSNTIVSPSSKARLKSQIEKNNIMVNAVQTQNSDISNKIMTQQQFESKSNVIKK